MTKPIPTGLYRFPDGSAAFIDSGDMEERWIAGMVADQEQAMQAEMEEQARTEAILEGLGDGDPPDEDFITLPGLVRDWDVDVDTILDDTPPAWVQRKTMSQLDDLRARIEGLKDDIAEAEAYGADPADDRVRLADLQDELAKLERDLEPDD